MKALRLVTATFLVLVAVEGVAEPNYPRRPITVIIPFAAGGPNDTVGRIVAERMKVSLGQPVVIENVGGGSGNVGVGRAARATPDGYTLIIGNWATHVANGAVYSLPYDLLDDFEPVALLSTESMLFVARAGLPANDLQTLTAWLKSNPDKATAGTTGPGSIAHVVGAFFQRATGTSFQFVPYRSLGLAVQDVIAGRIDVMFDTSANSLPHVQAGNVRAIAVTSKTRLPEIPAIQTVREAGLPQLEVSSWRAMWAPKGTPKPIIDRLNAAAIETLADQGVRKQFSRLGQDVAPDDQQSPRTLAAYHRAEIEKWWPVIKAAGIKPQ